MHDFRVLNTDNAHEDAPSLLRGKEHMFTNLCQFSSSKRFSASNHRIPESPPDYQLLFAVYQVVEDEALMHLVFMLLIAAQTALLGVKLCNILYISLHLGSK